MNHVEFLTIEDVVELIRKLEVGPVRDIGLLDSAIARPRSSAFGEDAYSSIDLKAAALLHSLTKNHALVDGNKRVAWLATTVFLRLNHRLCELSDDEAFVLVWELATRDIALTEIASRLNI